jgi:hypothetical protein
VAFADEYQTFTFMNAHLEARTGERLLRSLKDHKQMAISRQSGTASW